MPVARRHRVFFEDLFPSNTRRLPIVARDVNAIFEHRPLPRLSGRPVPSHELAVREADLALSFVVAIFLPALRGTQTPHVPFGLDQVITLLARSGHINLVKQFTSFRS